MVDGEKLCINENIFISMLRNEKFQFFAKINLCKVRMTEVGLSATSERSMTPVSSGV